MNNKQRNCDSGSDVCLFPGLERTLVEMLLATCRSCVCVGGLGPDPEGVGTKTGTQAPLNQDGPKGVGWGVCVQLDSAHTNMSTHKRTYTHTHRRIRAYTHKEEDLHLISGVISHILEQVDHLCSGHCFEMTVNQKKVKMVKNGTHLVRCEQTKFIDSSVSSCCRSSWFVGVYPNLNTVFQKKRRN